MLNWNREFEQLKKHTHKVIDYNEIWLISVLLHGKISHAGQYAHLSLKNVNVQPNHPTYEKGNL